MDPLARIQHLVSVLEDERASWPYLNLAGYEESVVKAIYSLFLDLQKEAR